MPSQITLLFDEHLPASTVEELRNRNIDAEAVYETELQSDADKEIREYAEQKEKVIVTQDSDFLQKDEDVGIIFLTEPLEIGELTRQILKVIQNLQKTEIENSTIYIPWD